MSLVASVPDELVDSGRMDEVALSHSDKVLVVVLIDSTEDSRYDSLGGSLLNAPSSSTDAPLLITWCWWSIADAAIPLLLVFCDAVAAPPIRSADGDVVVEVGLVGTGSMAGSLLLEA